MSSAKHYFSGNGKPPAEKLNFAQTCNRLSLFLKENGSLRDLNLGINPKFDSKGFPEISPAIIPAKTATVDLLSNIEYRGEKASKSENISPQYIILDSSCEVDDSKNKVSSSKAVTSPKSAQMTIFYGGNVIVLDDFPEDKARDLMLMAENRFELASTSKPPSGVFRSPQPIDHVELQMKDSDLPIARRASLHKFLAKRKERATVRAPYPVHHQSPVTLSSGKEHGFDLNL